MCVCVHVGREGECYGSMPVVYRHLFSKMREITATETDTCFGRPILGSDLQSNNAHSVETALCVS